jgi:hypothetical protein
MKSGSIILALLFFIPSLTMAGEIFGTIKKDGQPLINTEVKITKEGKVVATATTDKNGYFTVTIQQVGRYKLELTGFEGASFDVVSTNNSTGYTLSLAKVADKWQLTKQ